MKRPILWAAAALAVGIYAARAIPAEVPLALGLVSSAALLGVLRRLFAPRLAVSEGAFQALLAVLLFSGSGAGLWQVRHAGPAGDDFCRYLLESRPALCIAEGRVLSAGLLLPGATRTQFVLAIDRIYVEGTRIPVSGRAQVYWSQAAFALHVDECVRVRGEPEAVLGPVNFGARGYEDYLRTRGVHSAIRAANVEGVTRVSPARWWHPGYWASRLRAFEGVRLAQAIPEKILPFVLAVWIGDRSGVGGAEFQSYVETGTAHILSISGVHVGLIFVSVSALLRMMQIQGRLRALLIIIGILLYALVAGASTACMRAAAMIVLYLLSELFDREPDSPTALSLSAILFLAWNPDLLFDLSFVLSYSCVASILLFQERISAFLADFPAPVRGGLTTAASVQLLPFPLGVYFFNVLPVLSPLANLLVIPLLAIVLWLACLTTITALLSVHAALIFGYALLVPVELIRLVANWGAAVPGAYLRMVTPTAVAMIAYWCAVAAGSGFFPGLPVGKRKRLLVVCLFLVLAWLTWQSPFHDNRVVFLDVQHGDASLIRSAAGENVLIDAGSQSSWSDMGTRVVAPYLWNQGIDHLDCVVATHMDDDHAGGLDYILGHFAVDRLVLGPFESGTPLEASLLDTCKRRQIPVHRVRRGDTIALKEAQLAILHPPSDWPNPRNENSASLVIALRWNGPGVLFTGDIEKEAEAALATSIGHSPILKVAHHGSKTSSSPEFIAAVAPRVCVVSTGRKSGKESADPATLERLRRQGAAILRTDREGAIALVLEPEGPRFIGARPERGFPVSPNDAYFTTLREYLR